MPTEPIVIVYFVLVSISIPDRFGETYSIVNSRIETAKACQDEALRLSKQAGGLMEFLCLQRTQVVRGGNPQTRRQQ